MSKSIQDLTIWMQQLKRNLGMDITITITTDKNFIIYDEKEGEPDKVPEVLYTGSEEGMDINDLPYFDAKVIAKSIKDTLLVKNITSEEL